MLNNIQVSAVSYTNTKPFIFGIQRHAELLKKMDLYFDIPSDCAKKLEQGTIDIGLVPSACLSQLPHYEIISDYCIGSQGAVNSVFIFSNKPIQQINSIRLDAQSRTSNGLARILLTHHWKHSVTFLSNNDVEKSDAMVLIGDRTFGRKKEFNYAYDMGDEWMKMTGLPFTYAVWTANKAIPFQFKQEFNEALRYGVSHIDELISGLNKIENFDLRDYFLNKLSYPFDKRKKEALNLYLHLLETLDKKDYLEKTIDYPQLNYSMS